MKSIGWLLVILGAVSFVLSFIGYNYEYLMWMDNWGVEVGWAIRAAMVVAGGVLILLGMKSEAGATEAMEPVQSAPQPELQPEPQGFEPQDPGPQGFESQDSDPQDFEPDTTPDKE